MKTTLAVALIILITLWYLSFLATRLDRLHHRVETSWANLDGLLQRRAAIALELARSDFADPASSLLLTASAYQAREATVKERSAAEMSLTGALSLLTIDGKIHANEGEQILLEELSALTAKIAIAIAIHTDAVSSTQKVRKKLAIRLFRLAGTAPLPVTYEFEFDAL
ncbi:MAG: hypothetical protein F2703_00015 [Actinobacteria bacterium]|uniref:Unannotated protein n=1 Tax=freshwater metagenome TaxID=449393 RepID=A0A6J6FV10_9ZZZZ|nr:hypothetical protein [Actinomycetota bacterium]MSY63431.1 hypothetical protein [Actinomycetota bacterium]MSZ90724.1 hypothetical protein [Actinomycetota bacterium]